jgi:hypothetical protein
MKKKVWLKDFFVINKKHHWFIFPTLIISYNKHTILETEVYTPSFGITFRWFTIMIGFQIQRSYL